MIPVYLLLIGTGLLIWALARVYRVYRRLRALHLPKFSWGTLSAAKSVTVYGWRLRKLPPSIEENTRMYVAHMYQEQGITHVCTRGMERMGKYDTTPSMHKTYTRDES